MLDEAWAHLLRIDKILKSWRLEEVVPLDQVTKIPPREPFDVPDYWREFEHEFSSYNRNLEHWK